MKPKVTLPATFIDDLSAVLYTPENIERANAYARSRGLDPTRFAIPWVACDANPYPFEYFKSTLPPIVFTDCLYIPILEVDSAPGEPPRLAGFDIRYLGDQPHRLRWHKWKRQPETPLIYNFHAALKSDIGILTEGAIDAESFRTVGFDAVGALTALYTPRFVHFLIATFKTLYLAYDNDEDGQKATRKIIDYLAKHPAAHDLTVKPLIYPGKDPSKALQTFGADHFRQKIEYQFA